jgi:hypothetical protein
MGRDEPKPRRPELTAESARVEPRWESRERTTSRLSGRARTADRGALGGRGLICTRPDDHTGIYGLEGSDICCNQAGGLSMPFAE